MSKKMSVSGKCNICGDTAAGQVNQEDFQFFNHQTGEWDWHDEVQVNLECGRRRHDGPRPGGIGHKIVTWLQFKTA